MKILKTNSDKNFAKKLEKAINYLDGWLDFRYRKNDYWPGFTVAISYNGEMQFNKSYGFANVERKEPLTPSHIFRIASHSKTFTATAAMQLVEKGRIGLADPVAKYLPWLTKHKDKHFQEITIKQLLSHHAGIIRDGLEADFWLLKQPFPDKEGFIKAVLQATLVLKSSKKMKYSNFGFTLLGLVIEEVSALDYNDYVQEYIIKPLNLKNTGPEYTSSVEKGLVNGYSMKDRNQKRHLFPKNIDTKIMSPATGFYSTAEDLCNYFTAQTIGSGKLLSDESKKLMQHEEVKILKEDSKRSYGLGFIITTLGKKKVFGHGGSFPGQITSTVCDEKRKLVITVLTNCIDGNATPFVQGIFSIIDYFDKNYSLTQETNLDKYQQRLANIWGVTDVVSMGDHLVSVEPNVYKPFQLIEYLKYLKDDTLKIGATNSFYSEGELVHYLFTRNGKIRSVKYAGLTMPPEKLT